MNENPYSKKERERIAAQILRYAKEGVVHSWGAHGYGKNEFGEIRRPMGSHESRWLEVIAEDVRGKIYHESSQW